MGTISEKQMTFSLANSESSEESIPEPISANIFTPKLLSNNDFDEPQASSSGLHMKPVSTYKSKDRGKPSFPWKFLQPKRGVSKLIFQVVASTEKRSGVSLQALKKSVAATGYSLEKRKNHFKRVLRALVTKGLLKKLTGRGLTGSYGISKIMLKVLRRRKRKRRRRRRRRKAIAILKKKKLAKQRKRKRRRSKKEKAKPEQSDPSNCCSEKSVTT
ncbi:histone H1-like [Ahaetulla prasina]|uniref:histone H1-like n=1 Tax=Ahaetulla prasina TaxID=499056 RepID=UPI002649A2BE|nr:histone H1-like [Ahaetulla prasina]